MKIQIDYNITAEWWDHDGREVVVRGIVNGQGFDVLLNIKKKYFLEEVPREVEPRAAEIAARVVAARKLDKPTSRNGGGMRLFLVVTLLACSLALTFLSAWFQDLDFLWPAAPMLFVAFMVSISKRPALEWCVSREKRLSREQ